MLDRMSKPEEKDIEARPIYQFGYQIEKLLNKTQPFVKSQCYLFSVFGDNLSQVRLAHKQLTEAFNQIIPVIQADEKAKGKYHLHEEYDTRLEDAKQQLIEMERELEEFQHNLDSKQAILLAKEKLLTEKLERLHEELSDKVEKGRKERNDHFISMQSRMQLLEKQRETVKKELLEMKKIKVSLLDKIKLKKGKKEVLSNANVGSKKEKKKLLSSVEGELKKVKADIARWMNKVIEPVPSEEINQLESDLTLTRGNLKIHEEMYLEEIILRKAKLEAAKEKVTIAVDKRRKRLGQVSETTLHILSDAREKVKALAVAIEQAKTTCKNDSSKKKVAALQEVLGNSLEEIDNVFNTLWCAEVSSSEESENAKEEVKTQPAGAKSTHFFSRFFTRASIPSTSTSTKGSAEELESGYEL